MEKVYIKINHQQNDYYLVWDIITEMPHTLPMDLATFVLLLSDDFLSINRLISTWKNIKNNSISVDKIDIKQVVRQYEYDFLCFQSEDTYIRNKVLDHSDLSQIVEDKLDCLSEDYQKTIIDSIESNILLDKLSKKFSEFIVNKLSTEIALLPSVFYSNIDDLYHRIYPQIVSEKKDDFRCFIYNINTPTKSEIEWYSKLLFSKNIEWYNLPLNIRSKYIITDKDFIIKQNSIPFLRNINDVFITNYKPSREDLLGYFNHLIGENFNFAIELKKDFEGLGFIDDSNVLTLSNLNYLIDNELLNSDQQLKRMPDELVNFIDAEGGKLFPPIYNSVFERQGLYVFYKYNIQLMDVYTKNGDLVFSNLDDIDIFLNDDEIVVTYEDNRGYRFFKKVIVQEGKPIQILSISPFEYPPVNF